MTLCDKDRRLLRLFTAIVLGEWDAVRAVRAEAPAGEPDAAWREAVLQAHLFAGFPRLVQAYGVLDECGGLGRIEPSEIEGVEFPPQRGGELFERIYGEDASEVRGMLSGYHADFGDWIAGHAYARVLARPGLGADRRELLACCALAALGQERQLASHARGSIRCGATREELLAALESVAELMPGERLRQAQQIVRRFL